MTPDERDNQIIWLQWKLKQAEHDLGGLIGKLRNEAALTGRRFGRIHDERQTTPLNERALKVEAIAVMAALDMTRLSEQASDLAGRIAGLRTELDELVKERESSDA